MSDPAVTTPSDPAGVDRTPTGEIATQTQTKSPAATTPQTSTSSTETPSLANQQAESLANQKPPEGAPTTYADYTVPEGYELDKAVATQANAIFKELNLTQAQAQKLVDFYTAKTTESANAPFDAWNNTQAEWVKEVKADPVMGPRIAEIQTTISKAIDGLGDPGLAKNFREAMDFTGAGNNPHFIKAFWKLAQKVTEGGHVAGNGPSPAGQANGSRPASAARAMYPNLP